MSHSRQLRRLAAAGAAALTLTACGGAAPSTVDNAAPSQPVGDGAIANPYAGGAVAKTAPKDTILMSGLLFYPKTLTVTPGQKIALINEDSSTHDVRTRDAKTISSGDLEGGRKGSVTMPTKPGDYEVICHFHPETMRMTVTVK